MISEGEEGVQEGKEGRKRPILRTESEGEILSHRGLTSPLVMVYAAESREKERACKATGSQIIRSFTVLLEKTWQQA